MCPMEQSGNIRLTEKFDNKPKCTIAHHVDRVSASLQPFFPNSRTQDGKQDQVKHDLRLTRWEAYPVCPWNRKPAAAAGQNTVDPSAHDRKTMQGVKTSKTSLGGLFEIFAPSQYASGIRNMPPNRLMFPRLALSKPVSRKANAFTVRTP